MVRWNLPTSFCSSSAWNSLTKFPPKIGEKTWNDDIAVNPE